MLFISGTRRCAPTSPMCSRSSARATGSRRWSWPTSRGWSGPGSAERPVRAGHHCRRPPRGLASAASLRGNWHVSQEQPMLSNSKVEANIPAGDLKARPRLLRGQAGPHPVPRSSARRRWRTGPPAGRRSTSTARSTPARPGTPSRSGTSSDIDSEVRDLKAKGITFEVYDMPGVTWDGEIASIQGMELRRLVQGQRGQHDVHRPGGDRLSPADRAGRPPDGDRDAGRTHRSRSATSPSGRSSGGSSAPSWNTWAAVSTTESMNPATPPPTRTASGWTSSNSSRSSAPAPSATPAATSSPATAGRTAWPAGEPPRPARPRWHSLESNQVGLEEFARWCKLTGSELMMAVNLGTRGIEAALDLLEYANHPSGTTLSDQRIANGAKDPYNIRMWCLGNEMDGPWQIGHMSAEDTARSPPAPPRP